MTNVYFIYNFKHFFGDQGKECNVWKCNIAGPPIMKDEIKAAYNKKDEIGQYIC